MAWQNPKTDWGRADGVRDIDLNRIEGNILELYNAAAHADIMRYVSISGNDTSGSGTAASPYRTITKALSSIPRNLNGKSAIISVSEGSYAEAVTVSGFNTPITFTTSGANVTVSSFRVDGCHCSLSNAIITSNGTVYVTNCGTLTGAGTIKVEGANVTVNYGSTLSVDTVECNNSPGFAISVDGASRFFAWSLGGYANTNGLACQGGSSLGFGDISMEIGSLTYFTSLGGRIYSGAQTNAPIY